MAYKGFTEARKRANEKYIKEKTDGIRIRCHKGTREAWKAAAAKKGVSMTAYIKMAVERQIAEDQQESNATSE